MNILDVINSRRSIRSYLEEEVSSDIIEKLILLGTKAATGSNQQPWGFVVVQGKDEIQNISEDTKVYLLKNIDKYDYLKDYEKLLGDSTFSVFNHASTLLLIYGNKESHWHVYDCTLAASNIMLAAHSMDIGTCWIGFAQDTLNTKEFKEKYNVPENYELVCPMSIGYMKTKQGPPHRKPPIVFNSK